MKTLRNIALASAAALALAAAAYAQEEKKPEPAAKPQASEPHRHGQRGMHETRGGCHGESKAQAPGAHRHS